MAGEYLRQDLPGEEERKKQAAFQAQLANLVEREQKFMPTVSALLTQLISDEKGASGKLKTANKKVLVEDLRNLLRVMELLHEYEKAIYVIPTVKVSRAQFQRVAKHLTKTVAIRSRLKQLYDAVQEAPDEEKAIKLLDHSDIIVLIAKELDDLHKDLPALLEEFAQ